MSVEPGNRKLLRLEVRNAETPIERKPPWIKTRARMGPEYTNLKALVKREGLHTVCEEAGCPNIFECWEDREATFLIGGEQCTRRCDFCQIDTGKPAELDRDEPRRVAESVAAIRSRPARGSLGLARGAGRLRHADLGGPRGYGCGAAKRDLAPGFGGDHAGAERAGAHAPHHRQYRPAGCVDAAADGDHRSA